LQKEIQFLGGLSSGKKRERNKRLLSKLQGRIRRLELKGELKMTERERLVELVTEAIHKKGIYEDIADHLLSNGIRVEIPNNSVSLINGHIDEGVKK
jgi:hypothetical protein